MEKRYDKRIIHGSAETKFLLALTNIFTIHINNTFGDFLKISEDSPKFVQKSDECFKTFSEDF